MRYRLHGLFTAGSILLCVTALVLRSQYPWDALPLGWLAAVFLVWPVWQFVSWLRSDSEVLRRIDYGLCRDCGYDLRRNSGQCPECGRQVKSYESVRLRAGTD